MRWVLLFFLRCWQGPLLAPSRKTWELHFFPVDKPVSYPFHTCFILKKHKYIYTHSTLNMSFTHSRINASHVFNLYIYNSVRLLWLKSSARIHRNYLINELNWKSIFSSCIIAYNFSFYYIHFEITGDPCNLIGSQQCDLFTNSTIFALNHICSKLRHSCSKSHHFCSKSQHFCSTSHQFCFDYKMSVKAFLLPLFIKPTPRSIIIWYWLNSVISKWL